MATQLTPEQEKELGDWAHKAFAEAKDRTERDMQLLNELSRKRAEDKFGWRADRPPTPRHLRIMDAIIMAIGTLLFGMGLMYLLLL